MIYFRQIVEALPETITVSSALRNQRVEIIYGYNQPHAPLYTT